MSKKKQKKNDAIIYWLMLFQTFWGGNTKAAVTDDNLSVTIHFIAFFAIEWKWMVTEAFIRPTFLFVLNRKEKKQVWNSVCFALI